MFCIVHTVYYDICNEKDIILTTSVIFYRSVMERDPSTTHTAHTPFIHLSANANAESDGGSRLAAAVHLSVT